MGGKKFQEAYTFLENEIHEAKMFNNIELRRDPKTGEKYWDFSAATKERIGMFEDIKKSLEVLEDLQIYTANLQ